MILPEATLFPQALLPLFIFEPRYRRMLAESLDTHRLFAVAMLKPGATRESPMGVAGLGLIRASVQNPDGTSHLVLQGLTRIELEGVVRYRPYRVHRIRPLQPAASDSAISISFFLFIIFRFIFIARRVRIHRTRVVGTVSCAPR